MSVTRHQHHKQTIFLLFTSQPNFGKCQLAKYLGITITENMDWDQHISEISSKATKTLDFLCRNLAFAPRSTKKGAYKTLIWPKLEYATTIWSPYTKLQINQMEKVQRTAAQRGGVLSSHFFYIFLNGSGPASTVHPPKNIRNFKHPKKKYLKFYQPQKISPILYLDLKKRP